MTLNGSNSSIPLHLLTPSNSQWWSPMVEMSSNKWKSATSMRSLALRRHAFLNCRPPPLRQEHTAHGWGVAPHCCTTHFPSDTTAATIMPCMANQIPRGTAAPRGVNNSPAAHLCTARRNLCNVSPCHHQELAIVPLPFPPNSLTTFCTAALLGTPLWSCGQHLACFIWLHSGS